MICREAMIVVVGGEDAKDTSKEDNTRKSETCAPVKKNVKRSTKSEIFG